MPVKDILQLGGRVPEENSKVAFHREHPGLTQWNVGVISLSKRKIEGPT